MTSETPQPAAVAPRPDAVDVLDTSEAGSRLIRGGMWRALGYVGGILLSLAAVPLMIRHLGVVRYGQYMTVAAIIFMVAGVSEAGLTNLGVREYSTLAPGDREPLLRNLVGLRGAITIVGVAIAVGIVAVGGSPHVVVLGTAIAGGALVIAMFQQGYAIPLQATLRLGWTSALDLIQQAASTITIVALVVAGASLLPFFFNTVIGQVVMLIATLAVIGRHAPIRPAFDLSVWRRLLRDTLPYAVAAAVGIIYFREAVVLTSFVGTARETGYFSAAFRIVEVIAIVPWILVSSSFPILARAARDNRTRLRYALGRLFDVGLILGVGMTLCTFVGAPFGIAVVAGPGFGPSVAVLRILSFATIATFLVATFAFALLSLRMHRALLVANAIAVAVATAATLALVPVIGERGSAVAPVAAEASLALAYAIFLFRAHPELRVSPALVPRVALAAAVAGGAAALAPLPSWALILLAAAVYLAALALLRAIPPEILHALRQRRHPVTT